MNIRKILCKIGIHRWDTREVHITSVDRNGLHSSYVLERCSCGESRFAVGGYLRPTTFHIRDDLVLKKPQQLEFDY